MTGEEDIHRTAEIAEGATIGCGTKIWQHCIVMAGAKIGMNCKLAHNVFVESGARLGDKVTVKDNVALYDGVDVEDRVFIGPNAVFTNVRNPRAFIKGRLDRRRGDDRRQRDDCLRCFDRGLCDGRRRRRRDARYPRLRTGGRCAGTPNWLGRPQWQETQ